MSKQTHRGSCLCGRVRFEADIDFAEGTLKCNCTRCLKQRWWTVSVKPESFRPLIDEASLKTYPEGPSLGHKRFCPHCGVAVYAAIEAADWNDGAYVSINVATLDGLEPATLASIPVRYLDGLHDNWWVPPAVVSYL